MYISELSAKEISILALVTAFQIAESASYNDVERLAGFFVILSDVLAFLAEDMEPESEVPLGD